jgi:hypothetical protein
MTLGDGLSTGVAITGNTFYNSPGRTLKLNMAGFLLESLAIANNTITSVDGCSYAGVDIYGGGGSQLGACSINGNVINGLNFTNETYCWGIRVGSTASTVGALGLTINNNAIHDIGDDAVAQLECWGIYIENAAHASVCGNSMRKIGTTGVTGSAFGIRVAAGDVASNNNSMKFMYCAAAISGGSTANGNVITTVDAVGISNVYTACNNVISGTGSNAMDSCTMVIGNVMSSIAANAHGIVGCTMASGNTVTVSGTGTAISIGAGVVDASITSNKLTAAGGIDSIACLATGSLVLVGNNFTGSLASLVGVPVIMPGANIINNIAVP